VQSAHGVVRVLSSDCHKMGGEPSRARALLTFITTSDNLAMIQ